jgi:hypothetical protein
MRYDKTTGVVFKTAEIGSDTQNKNISLLTQPLETNNVKSAANKYCRKHNLYFRVYSAPKMKATQIIFVNVLVRLPI